MIELLLGGEVAVAELRRDARVPIPFAEEERVVERACPRRRREFATARSCARRALAELGIAPVPIPRGPAGEPLWPPGVVGSITHCDGLRAAAVARRSAVASLGIDAEPNAPLPQGVFERIASGPERELRGTAEAGGGEAVHLDRLLFSAKESVYKAWFGLCPRWLGFEHAEVSVDREAMTFAARLLVPGPWLGGQPLQELRGRWMVAGGLIASAVLIPAPGSRGADAGPPQRSPAPGP